MGRTHDWPPAYLTHDSFIGQNIVQVLRFLAIQTHRSHSSHVDPSFPAQCLPRTGLQCQSLETDTTLPVPLTSKNLRTNSLWQVRAFVDPHIVLSGEVCEIGAQPCQIVHVGTILAVVHLVNRMRTPHLLDFICKGPRGKTYASKNMQ